MRGAHTIEEKISTCQARGFNLRFMRHSIMQHVQQNTSYCKQNKERNNNNKEQWPAVTLIEAPCRLSIAVEELSEEEEDPQIIG